MDALVTEPPAPPAVWSTYYRGVVRASLHRPAGRPPDLAAAGLVYAVEAQAGRPLRGPRDFASVVLPAVFGELGLDIVVAGEREIEYRWRSCACADLQSADDRHACVAGMQFHEAVARIVMPDLVEFRALEHDADGGGHCRVLVRR